MKYTYVFILCLVLAFIIGCSLQGETTGPNTSDKDTAAPATESPAFTVTPIPVKITETPAPAVSEMPDVQSLINPAGMTILERFSPPAGYIPAVTDNGGFPEFLRNLPLKPDGAKVHYYDGRVKSRDVYLAVVDYTLGDRDLQQCADAVIRLRAEYLYATDQFDKIQFHFVSGFLVSFSKWSEGYSISVNGNDVQWKQNSSNNDSYESFQKYLDIVYAYASTLSLERELEAKDISELSIGDVFIRGGSPGHCVVVVDMAVHESTGEKLFILAQSYMPAQDIQILKNPASEYDSPWYSETFNEILKTPEWSFSKTELRTWGE